ncbi:MAG: hypothetical protein IJF75_05345 [Clostridia bacterium]|nr:hypothetical protein [Clostridia bacterium]
MENSKKTLKIVFVVISILMLILHFIPWMCISYVLPGYTSDGQEITSTFINWLSPFYQTFFASSPFFMIVIFISSLISNAFGLIYSIGWLTAKKFSDKKKTYIAFSLSIALFLLMVFMNLIGAPKA